MSILVNTASNQDLDQLATLFRVLADRTRLQILLALAEGDLNVSAICDRISLPQPTVSHHLALLRMNNIVGNRREGKQIIYGLDGRVRIDDEGQIELNVQNHTVRISPR